jgi:hypothetical protein
VNQNNDDEEFSQGNACSSRKTEPLKSRRMSI